MRELMSNEKRKKITVNDIVVVGLMAALVFAGTNIRIYIPTLIDKTMIHFGNVFGLLAGLLFGGLRGGLGAGIGSAFYDLMDPSYIASAPFTLINKFMMGFVAGALSHRKGFEGKKPVVNVLASIAGSLTYVVLYVGKSLLENIFFNRTAVQTALIDAGQKALVSTVNGLIAVIAANILAIALRAALEKTGIYQRLTGRTR